MTKMEPTLVKYLKDSLQKPLPPWSTGFAQTFLLSAVDAAEPRRVMVNGWANVQHTFLPEFNTGKSTPIQFPHRYKNNNSTVDQHHSLPARNEETVPGGEGEPFNREGEDITLSAWNHGSRDTVEAPKSASAPCVVTVDTQDSVRSGESTPGDASFDEFVRHITSF